jgi:hypothetical protein
MSSGDYKQILSDFLNGVRGVGASYAEKELSNKTIEQIEKVKVLFRVVNECEIEYKPAMTRLCEECNWDLYLLLDEILTYPKVIPRVRRLNGELYHAFNKVIPSLPMDIGIKRELLHLASKVSQTEKRIELTSLIEKEESMLYVAGELSRSRDLMASDRKRADELFSYFW